MGSAIVIDNGSPNTVEASSKSFRSLRGSAAHREEIIHLYLIGRMFDIMLKRYKLYPTI